MIVNSCDGFCLSSSTSVGSSECDSGWSLNILMIVNSCDGFCLSSSTSVGSSECDSGWSQGVERHTAVELVCGGV